MACYLSLPPSEHPRGSPEPARPVPERVPSIGVGTIDRPRGVYDAFASRVEGSLPPRAGAGVAASTWERHTATPLATRPISESTFFLPKHRCIQKANVDPKLDKLSDKEIVIAGEIISDGFGDLFNMLTVIEEIIDKYPGQKIRLVIHIEEGHFEHLGFAFPLPHNVTVDVLFYPTPCVEEHKACRLRALSGEKIKFPEELLKMIQNSALTIGYSTSETPHYLLDRPTFTFDEPGCGRSTLSYSEGIGIYIREKRSSLSLSEVSHSWLKEILGSIYTPSDKLLSFAYFSSCMGSADLSRYVYMAASELTRPSQDLVIITNIGSQTLDVPTLAEALSHFEISEIVIKRPHGGDETISVSSSGTRKIYILDPFPLSHQDFTILSACSTAKLVGCTGDQSLGGVLQDLHHIPFYQVRKHKLSFWNDLIMYCKTNLGDEHPYVRFLELSAAVSTKPAVEGGAESNLALKDLDTMISFMKETDFYDGAERVHSSILTKKSLPKFVCMQVETKIKKVKGADALGSEPLSRVADRKASRYPSAASAAPRRAAAGAGAASHGAPGSYLDEDVLALYFKADLGISSARPLSTIVGRTTARHASAASAAPGRAAAGAGAASHGAPGSYLDEDVLELYG